MLVSKPSNRSKAFREVELEACTKDFQFQNLLTGLRHSGASYIILKQGDMRVSKPSNRSKAFRARQPDNTESLLE